MTRILWLVFERLPHPDAVAYPADEADVQFVLELLAQPYPQRVHLARQLRNYEAEQLRQPVFERRTVPCRRATGLYHLVSWRLAKWLVRVLPAEDAVISRTAAQLRRWLNDDWSANRLNATPRANSPPIQPIRLRLSRSIAGETASGEKNRATNSP